MRKLILIGEIGCGKTTIIRDAIADSAACAGGFVTFRSFAPNGSPEFHLASPKIWVHPETGHHRFLHFNPAPVRNDQVFSGYGVSLLEDAIHQPFAIADEFGGLELLIPAFLNALLALLHSDTPTIGVIKTPESARILAQRIAPGKEYLQVYESLLDHLKSRQDVLLLPVRGWQDPAPKEMIRQWVEKYVGR